MKKKWWGNGLEIAKAVGIRGEEEYVEGMGKGRVVGRTDGERKGIVVRRGIFPRKGKRRKCCMGFEEGYSKDR